MVMTMMTTMRKIQCRKERSNELLYSKRNEVSNIPFLLDFSLLFLFLFDISTFGETVLLKLIRVGTLQKDLLTVLLD